MKKNHLTVIIPAAETNRRTPRSLIELNYGKNLLNEQINMIRSELGEVEIIVVLGLNAEKVIKTLPENIKIVENENYKDSNVVRSINMALRVANNNNNILVVYSDILFNKYAIHRTAKHGCSTIIVDNENQIEQNKIGVNIIDNIVSRFGFGLSNKWTGILYLAGKELELFRKEVSEAHHKKLFTYEILNNIIDRGAIIKPIFPKLMEIVEINSLRDIKKAKAINENIVQQ